MSQYFEISGILEPSSSSAVGDGGRVVLSSLTAGAAGSAPQPNIGIKYVATGTEIYRYGGKTYPVRAGNFLLVPGGYSGDVEIGKSGGSATIGLCIYLPSPAPAEGERLDAPMIFPASCSKLGATLAGTVAQMMRPMSQRSVIADRLFTRVAPDLEPLVEETLRMISGIDAQKAATRYETMRRLNAARGYLHEVTDRPVDLAELAKVSGISRFQLLRNFRDVFGTPPAAYHRNLRLGLAKQEVDGRRLTCSEAAHRFGFADCSSFSHAYRRVFGEPPIRRLAA